MEEATRIPLSSGAVLNFPNDNAALDACHAEIAAEREKREQKAMTTGEQEWTELAKALRVHADEVISPQGTNASLLRQNCKRAADLLDAHNAALAACHAEIRELERSRERIGQQLAAERERREIAERSAKAWEEDAKRYATNAVDERAKALAELEGFMKKQADDYDRDMQDCHRKLSEKTQQLAAEADGWRKAMSAAADLAKQTFAEKDQQLAAERENRDGFRRALEQRIGEADELREKVQALVDALVYYRDECSGNEPSLSVFHRKLDDALAKVK